RRARCRTWRRGRLGACLARPARRLERRPLSRLLPAATTPAPPPPPLLPPGLALGRLLGAGAGLLRRGASARPLHREEGDGPLTGRRYAARAALAPPALAPAPPFLALAGLERERARRGRAIATAGAGQLTLGPAAALLL